MQTVYDPNNIFARILRGEIPAIKVYEDDHTLAFMDIMPQIDGHVLVIPKQAAVTVFELSAESALACMKTVQKVGQAIVQALQAPGITLFQQNGAGIGQTVPHAHFHLLPGSVFQLKGHQAAMGDMALLQQLASQIRAALPA